MRSLRTRHGLLLLLVSVTLLASSAAVSANAETATVHEQVRCADCHRSGGFAITAGTATDAASADASRQCLTCHESDHGDHPFHLRDDRACTACHVFHDPSRVRAGDREFNLPASDVAVQNHCQACHRSGARLGLMDAGHRFAAAAVYHDDTRDLDRMSPSDACLVCHDSMGAGIEMPVGVPEVPRFSAHATHPFGIRFRPGQGQGDRAIRHDIDPRLPLPDGRIECVTCHDVTAGTVDLLVPFDDPYALCLGCHRVGDDARDPDVLALAGRR